MKKKQKTNLGQMAFATFQKKAQQLGTKLKKGIGTMISLKDLCSKEEVIYLWSWEKGFEYLDIDLHILLKSKQPPELGFVIAKMIEDHIDKKDDSFVPSHFGIYNKTKKEMVYFSIIRISDIINGGTKESDALLEIFRHSAEIDQIQKLMEG